MPGTIYPPHVDEFCRHLSRSIFRSLGDSVTALANEHGSAYLDDFEDHLRLLRAAFPGRPWPKWPADGYVRLNKAILKEESEFRESGRYSAGADDLDRVKQDVYDNPDVMEQFYLVGLYCTYFLWQHHYRILTFYRRNFVTPAEKPVSAFAEWGVGHGLLTLQALRCWTGATATLADISEHSLGFSSAVLTAAGMGSRFSTTRCDVLDSLFLPVDRLVCSELLEHVADPAALLGRARESLTADGVLYLTGAVNAPQPDHVYLFRSAGELLDLVAASGLRVQSHVAVCHPNREGDPKAPTVVALVASR